MSDREEICKTLDAYVEHADECRFREWAELFVPDGWFEAFERRFAGREKLEKFISRAATGKHAFDNPDVQVEGDRARVSSPFRFVGDDPEMNSRGVYHDVLVRTPEGWRFESRRVEFYARGRDALDG